MKFIKSLIMIISLMTITYAIPQEEVQYKAIIFDMDGTILDTEPIWDQAYFYLLSRYAPNLDISEKQEIMNCLKSLKTEDKFKILQKNSSINVSIKELKQEKRKIVHELYETQGVCFIHFFTEFHNQVFARDIKTAIATNASQKAVHAILKKAPLADYFAQHIYTRDHVNRRRKPEPDIYLYAAKMLGVQPCNCIAIEDSSSGIKAAKSAGMYCIAINTGENRQLLEQADEIVECFSEIDLNKFNFVTA